MSLYSLINNQTVMIDNHHSAHLIGWERNLHIHKRMDKESKSSLEFRLYFADRNRGIEFFNQKGKDYQRIENEIYDAFDDPIVRRKFIDSFYNEIQPIVDCDRRSPADMRRVAKRAARRIALFFGLNDEILDEFIERADLFFSQFNDKYIAVDFSNNSILIGGDKKRIIEASR